MSYGFSDDGFVDVNERYSSMGYNALLHPPGYTPLMPRFDFEKHTDAMIFQIVPRIQDGEALPPCIERQGETIPTGWFQRVPLINTGIADRVSLIAFDPGAEKKGKVVGREHPYQVLRNRVSRGVSTKACNEGWKKYVEGRDCAIPAISDRYFVQSVVWTNGTERAFDESNCPMGMRKQDKELALQSLSKTAIECIRAAVMAAYAAGIESISLGAPQYFGMVNRKKFPNVLAKVSFAEYQRSQRAFENPIIGGDVGVSSTDRLSKLSAAAAANVAEEDDEFAGYSVAMTDHCYLCEKTQVLADLPRLNWQELGWDVAMKYKWKPWSQIFRVMDFDEQARHIAIALADLGPVLHYAWGDTAYWTDEIAGICAKRATIAMNVSRLDDSTGGSVGLGVGVGQASNHSGVGVGVNPAATFANNPHAAGNNTGAVPFTQSVVSSAFRPTPTNTQNVQPAQHSQTGVVDELAAAFEPR